MKKNLNFDFDVSSLEDYVKTKEDEILTSAVTGAPTLEVIRVETGIKGTQEVPILDTDTPWQDASACGLDATGDTTIGKFDLSVVRVGWRNRFCNEDLVGKFTQNWLGAGAMEQDEDLPIEAQIVNRIIEKERFKIENAIWRSNSALSSGNLQYFDGFKTIFDASSVVNELNGYGSTPIVTNVTNTNAFDVFMNVVDRMDDINEGIADSGEMVIFTDRAKYSALFRNMLNANLYHFDPQDGKSRYEMFLPGTNVRVRVATGLNDGAFGGIYAGKASEFTFGTDLMSDMDSFKVWFDDKDDVIYMQAKYRLGVGVPFLDQIGKFTVNGTSSI